MKKENLSLNLYNVGDYVLFRTWYWDKISLGVGLIKDIIQYGPVTNYHIFDLKSEVLSTYRIEQINAKIKKKDVMAYLV
jgi:hypothetical protein